MRYLLDTNAWIQYVKDPNSLIRARLSFRQPREIVTCSVIKAELLHGAEKQVHADAGHAGVVAEHLVQGFEGFELNLAFGHFVHHLVDQDGLGLEFVAAVDQVDLVGDRSEEHTSELQSH